MTRPRKPYPTRILVESQNPKTGVWTCMEFWSMAPKVDTKQDLVELRDAFSDSTLPHPVAVADLILTIKAHLCPRPRRLRKTPRG